MCPYSDLEKAGAPNRMEEDLYSKILAELEKVRTIRSFTLMLQNEPLLDTKIADRVREAKKAFNDTVSINITTNGSLLTPKRINELIEANTDTLSVSIDAFREDTYKAIHKRIEFSKVINNVQLLLKHNPRPKVIVKFLKQQANKGEEKAFINHWKALGADLLIHSVVNRAGTLKAFNYIVRPETRPIKLLIRRILNKTFPCCPLPFRTMTILSDGRVTLCCHDWGPAVTVGDLTKQSLLEVWNGKVMNDYRYLLYTGRAQDSLVCSNCSHSKGFWS
jgi:MoaA/NifB/PqqE/SkfB family radical SAM enzyme